MHLEARQFKLLLEQKVDSGVCITELVRCVNAAGKPFYAYIRIRPSEYIEYRYRLEHSERIDPNQYEIVEYGWGESPPEHVRQSMEEKYGVDHEFRKTKPDFLPRVDNHAAG